MGRERPFTLPFTTFFNIDIESIEKHVKKYLIIYEDKIWTHRDVYKRVKD